MTEVKTDHNTIYENSHPQEVRGEVYDIADLMKKRITGVGHRPWSTWDKSEPVMIADGELVRVTYDALVCINFQSWNNQLWPRTWKKPHCIWHLESRLFSLFEYDSRFIPERFNAAHRNEDLIDIEKDNE